MSGSAGLGIYVTQTRPRSLAAMNQRAFEGKVRSIALRALSTPTQRVYQDEQAELNQYTARSQMRVFSAASFAVTESRQSLR